MPPEQGAALCRAVARIPGVKVVRDGVDAAGRRGVAITCDDPDTAILDRAVVDRAGQRP